MQDKEDQRPAGGSVLTAQNCAVRFKGGSGPRRTAQKWTVPQGQRIRATAPKLGPSGLKMMCEYGFSESQDFASFLTESAGGRPVQREPEISGTLPPAPGSLAQPVQKRTGWRLRIELSSPVPWRLAARSKLRRRLRSPRAALCNPVIFARVGKAHSPRAGSKLHQTVNGSFTPGGLGKSSLSTPGGGFWPALFYDVAVYVAVLLSVFVKKRDTSICF